MGFTKIQNNGIRALLRGIITWATEASTSFVTVVAMVCFATGCADPIGTLPTVIVLRMFDTVSIKAATFIVMLT
jgi:hypothetical protein